MNFFLLTLLAVFSTASASIGDRLLEAYTVYDPLPLTIEDAWAKGWGQIGAFCNHEYGMKYQQDIVDPRVSLFFTSGGQIAGVSVRINGLQKERLTTEGWFNDHTKHNNFLPDLHHYEINIMFRPESIMCSNETSPDIIGDRIVINRLKGGISYNLPLTDTEAAKEGYSKGACFSAMGTHWYKDLSVDGKMSWEAANLMPVIPMYHEGKINSFFIAATTMQQSLVPPSANGWEPVPLLAPAMMCKNWCDDACAFPDTKLFSTMHFFFNDVEKVTCSGKCMVPGIQCCPGADPSTTNTSIILN